MARAPVEAALVTRASRPRRRVRVWNGVAIVNRSGLVAIYQEADQWLAVPIAGERLILVTITEKPAPLAGAARKGRR